MNIKNIKSWLGYSRSKEFVKLKGYQWKAKKYIARMPSVYDEIETLDLIAQRKCSVARYGDGEIGICFGGQTGFQQYDEQLSQRLRFILKEGGNPNLLVCIAPHCKCCYQVVPRTKTFIYKYFARHGKTYLDLLNPDGKYGSTFISRPDAFLFKDNQWDLYRERLRNLWAGRDVLVVTGKGSRFLLIDELFDNLKSAEFLYGPSENAFSQYREILNTIRSYSRDMLIIIALGPTATVLAYDLEKEGYHAIDIGHLPSCFQAASGGRKPVKTGY